MKYRGREMLKIYKDKCIKRTYKQSILDNDINRLSTNININITNNISQIIQRLLERAAETFVKDLLEMGHL